SHPSIGRNLLANIPRLEPIARMIEAQQVRFAAMLREDLRQDPVALGGQMLRLALELDRLLVQGVSFRAALGELQRHKDEFEPRLLAALDRAEDAKTGSTTKSVTVRELVTGMILDENVRAKNGMLLVARGQEVTQPVLERLRSFSLKVGIIEPF